MLWGSVCPEGGQATAKPSVPRKRRPCATRSGGSASRIIQHTDPAMCRYLAYLGPPRLLSEVIHKPPNSLVHQASASTKSLTRINADGFGVGWYAPDVSLEPAVFKSTSPVWNNYNLGSIAGKIRSPAIVGHVRAAKSYDPVNRENCHPFARGRLLWMHNGDIPGRSRLARQVAKTADDTLMAMIRGNTDSEMAFTVFLTHLEKPLARSPGVEELAAAMEETLRGLVAWHLAARETRPLELNFCVTDGASLVATRYALSEASAPSLYWYEGGNAVGESVTVASEPLYPEDAWRELAEGEMLLVQADLTVKRRALRASVPAASQPL